MKFCQLIMVLLWMGLCGCGGRSPSEGSEAAARKFFDAEFQKWMAGQETQVSTMMSRIENLKKPISYNIRSVVPDKPDVLAVAKDRQQNGKSEDTQGEWTAWKFNMVIEWKSQAGTPLEKVTTYTLTWNPRDRQWLVRERF